MDDGSDFDSRMTGDGRLIWKRPPTSVLIVKKNDDPVVTQALGIIASHFRRMKMVTFVESAAADDDAQSDTFSPGLRTRIMNLPLKVFA